LVPVCVIVFPETVRWFPACVIDVPETVRWVQEAAVGIPDEVISVPEAIRWFSVTAIHVPAIDVVLKVFGLSYSSINCLFHQAEQNPFNQFFEYI
jgi:hypothetical protein